MKKVRLLISSLFLLAGLTFVPVQPIDVFADGGQGGGDGPPKPKCIPRPNRPCPKPPPNPQSPSVKGASDFQGATEPGTLDILITELLIGLRMWI